MPRQLALGCLFQVISRGAAPIAPVPPSARLALHRAGRRWIAIERDGFVERRLEGLDLAPHPRSPIVWRFRYGDAPERSREVQTAAAERSREAQTASGGCLLNVVGWLEGGLVSVSTNGTLYVRESGSEAKALYLPGPAVHVDLGPKPPRILQAEGRKEPLFPDTWPKDAVRQVIRRRLRTVIVLAEETLLAELDGSTPP